MFLEYRNPQTLDVNGIQGLHALLFAARLHVPCHVSLPVVVCARTQLDMETLTKIKKGNEKNTKKSTSSDSPSTYLPTDPTPP